MLLPASLLCFSPNTAARVVLLGCQAPTLQPPHGCCLAPSQSQLLAMASCTGLICYYFLHCSFHPSPPPPASSAQLLLRHAGQAPRSHLLHLLLPSAGNVPVPGVLMASLFPPSDCCSCVSSSEPPSLPTSHLLPQHSHSLFPASFSPQHPTSPDFVLICIICVSRPDFVWGAHC